MICPAYHSYFILDVEETRKTFSLFGADSLPRKSWDVDKEKYGIAKDVADWKKESEMRTISMNSIYNKIEDPFAMFAREYAEVDTAFYLDSAAVIADSQNYNDFQNIDQMIYLHHFGKYLPKKARISDQIQEDLKEEEEAPVEENLEEEEPKKKRKFWPFGKKNKEAKNDEEISEETNSESQ
jgi:hypothetical protein